MTPLPDVSVIIVSHARPENLRRLLTSLRFVDYPSFEVIVVLQAGHQDRFSDVFGVGAIKFVVFEQANISAARNMGIACAAGRVVAFCDDDAVPESSWLRHLVAPFEGGHIGAAGGFVLGRNGISLQWGARSFDRMGSHRDLDISTEQPAILAGNAETGIKTEGTNCAFLRTALIEIGGFDDNFHYYLDETDVNYRLGLAGWKTALVPLARVHHGFAASMIRHQSRAPRSLFEIGASKSYFCQKHAAKMDIGDALTAFRATQKRRLIDFMVRGGLEPRDISDLLKTLDSGLKAGAKRTKKPGLFAPEPPDFRPFPGNSKGMPAVGLSCGPLARQKARRQARTLAAEGVPVTVFEFSRTALYHSMQFDPEGFWVQQGGVFGRSRRDSAIFQPFTFKSRLKAECARLSPVREIKEISVIGRR